MKRLETEADSQTGQSAMEGETSEEEIENNHNSRVTFLLTWNRSVIQSLWMVILRTIVLKPLPKKTQFGNLEERKIHTRMRDVVSNENDNHWILQQCSLSHTFLESWWYLENCFQNFWREMWVISSLICEKAFWQLSWYSTPEWILHVSHFLLVI